MKKDSIRILFIVATLLVGVACGEKIDGPDDNGSGASGGKVSSLNGTAILESSNMIGIVKDNTGKPIAGVPVSDGYSFVTTDDNGVYQMTSSRYARKAYITIPAGYEVPLHADTHLPNFYSPGTIVRSKQNRWDFTLTPLSKPEDKITLVMISDPQCQTSAQVSRYMDETIPNIQSVLGGMKDQYPNPYAFTLGDIIFDSTNLWPEMKRSMSNVRYGDNYLPFFQCIGNHDHTATTASDFDATAKFFENFGPTDYSINRGNVHIIVMDDIICSSVKTNSSPDKATWVYDGGFTAAQWKWLQEDLDLVSDKSQKMVVLCLHIPFRAGSSSGGSNVNKTGSYYSEVLGALKQFKEAHIMIGHTHYPQNWIHSSYRAKGGLPIYEHVHGASCGAWWACNSNTDGCPNGYGLYEVDTKNATMIDWTAKYTKTDFSYQMRVYNGNDTYTGTKGYVYNWITTTNGGPGTYNVGGSANLFAKGNAAFKNAFVVALWNDDEANWKVDYYKDGVKAGEFKRIPNGGSCDVCVTSYFFNELNKNTDSWTKSTASHYWYFVPESGDPASEKNWEVRATQTIPSSGKQHTYVCSAFTSDYSAF